MKRFRKVSNGRSSSSKTRAAAHVTEQSEAERIIPTQKANFASLYEEEEDDEAAYGLRQNPKTTCKISSSKTGVNQQKFICSKCGKGFQSSKAMCGHMACHSEKDKASSNVVAKQKVAMDSQSDSEPGAQHLRRRLRITRCKKKNFVADSKAKVDVFNNCSSGASGVEQEQEEVAISLMMLSRDSGNWGGLSSVGDSSDNNSVVLEDRSISTKLAMKKGLISGHHANEAMKKCGSEKLKTLGDSESGYVRNGAKNAGMDVKIRNLRKNKLPQGSKAEPHLSLKKLKCVMDEKGLKKYELSRNGDGYSHIQRPQMDSYSTKNDLMEDKTHQPFNPSVTSHKIFKAASPDQSGQNSSETDAYHSARKGKGILDDKSGKQCKHECPVHFAQGSEGMKCDEVAANFKRNETQLHEFLDLNLPAPAEDDEESMGSY